MTTLRSLTFCTVSAVLALAMVAGTAFAHPRGRNAPYTVTVEDASGRELPVYHHGGRTYILGSWGARYNIRVENRTARRIEAVVSVDGRDVVTGRMGDYVNGRGYLVEAYDSVVIEGFRQSLDQVAAFRFTDPADSYSSRMGTPENVGVIGVAIFPERQRRIARAVPRPRPRPKPVPYNRYGRLGTGSGRTRSANPNPRAMPGSTERRESAAAEAPASEPARKRSADALLHNGYGGEAYADDSDRSFRQQNLGTQYGESRESQVHEVEFQRANSRHPSQLISLHYDDRQGLIARGIDVDRSYRYSRYAPGPNPFPQTRFAPPPPY